MGSTVTLVTEGSVAVITVDNPPVNAISFDVRKGLMDAVNAIAADSSVKAAVLACAGRTFFAGADISEFDAPMGEPGLNTVINAMEALNKPVVAALFGTALGGGLETALGCHYRVAVESARMGLPEITLGVVPGAGGTQRLPRLVGVEKALDLILSGRLISGPEAREMGLVDEVVAGDLKQGAVAYANALIARNAPARRTSELQVAEASPDVYEKALAANAKALKGRTTPALDIESIKFAAKLPFAQGLKEETRISNASLEQTESKALRALFFAEREVAKIPGLNPNLPARNVDKVGIIGAGTMGGGIAMSFANVGTPVVIVDVDQAAIDRGLATVKKNYEASVKRGRMTDADVVQRMSLISGSTDYDALKDVDLVVEAVFENMELKKDIFRKLDKVLKKGAILGTNTSTLDINEIGEATSRPQDVIGLHFFSPANVMRLLEIVRTDKTADDVIATAFAVAKKIKKTGVLARVCFGFIGNRMMEPYGREAQRLLLEGAMPADVDAALEEFGMAMGILAVYDMAGVDIGVKAHIANKDNLPDDPTYYRAEQLIYEKGWLGQKTQRGFYNYEGRDRKPNPEAIALFEAESARLGIKRAAVSKEEIQRRCLYAMVNEGAKILQEGIAIRSGDIDVVYTSGYGFPRHRGGPMCWADSVGLATVLKGIEEFAQRFGKLHWEPAALLVKLAKEGKTFSSYRS